METLNIPENNYNINIGYKIDDSLENYLKKIHKTKKIGVVVDEYVYLIYRNRLHNILKDFNYEVFTFPMGENFKTIETYGKALKFLSDRDFTRNDLLIAFGGGISGDLTGFIAATYLRGIDFIAVPTTLLSMVDSSVGGKNGVNFNGMKNQIGTFNFPKYVHIDYSFLETLDEKNINNGLAEMFKYSVLADEKLFDALKKKNTEIDYENVIKRCLEIKLSFVRGDEYDHGKRQYLNLGHTIGHGIEVLSNYKINHGQAIGIGMIYMARAAYKMGITEEKFYEEIMEEFEKYNLKTSYDFDTNEILKVLKHDKKIKGNRINLIIPIKIGKAINKVMDFNELKEIIELGKIE